MSRQRQVAGLAVVRAVLRIYPPRFRARFGQSMTDLYEERYRDARAHGRLAALVFVTRSVVNLAASGAYERLRLGSGRRTGVPPLRSEGSLSRLHADARHGYRMFVKRPGLSVTAVVALALGVGISTTMFSVRRSLLAPLPYSDQHQLMHIGALDVRSAGQSVMRVYRRELDVWRTTQRSFDGLAAYTYRNATVSDDAALPEVVRAAAVAANAFTVVGVRPTRGRVFDATEPARGGTPVVLISEDLWRSRYGGTDDIVRRSIRLDGVAHAVVGVMPSVAAFPPDIDAWMPLDLTALDEPRLTADRPPFIERWTLGVEVVGRLRAGVARSEAQAEFDQLAARLSAAYPDTNENVGILVQPLLNRFGLDASGRLMFTLMFLATVGVLLIACANVANLLLARAIVRSREIALRAALGASRARIVSLLLAESLALALPGTFLGFALALATVAGVNAALAPFAALPSWFEIHVDGLVFAFVAGLAGLSGVASGLLPAVYASGTDVNAVLKAEARGGAGRRVGRVSRALVIAELTIACALLIGCGFMIKNGMRVTLYDPPYATAGIMTAQLQLPTDRYADNERRAVFLRSVEERLAAPPEVAAATVSSNLPGTGEAELRYQPEGRPFDRTVDLPVTRSIAIRPTFFETFEVSPLAGRAYTDFDLASPQRVLLVNESFARRAFPDGAAVGRRVRFGSVDDPGEWSTIVGILPDMWAPGGFVYQSGAEAVFPLLRSSNYTYLAVRGRADAASLVPVIRREIAALDADLAPTDFMSMGIVANRHALFYASFGAAFLVSGMTSLFLAVIGLYSVMAFSVATRTYEMGVRMALGARARDVIGLVVRQGVLQIVVGLVVGIGIGSGLAIALRAIIAAAGGDTIAMRPVDPVVFGTIATVLAATGLTACVVPARRATRVDPMIACRTE